MPWLTSPAGQRAIELARQVRAAHPGDPAAAASSLQRLAGDLSASQRASALSQAELGETAARQYGMDPHDLLLTRDGLEQGTRPEVSRARIQLMDLPAGCAIVDGTAGLGLDTRAFIEAGLSVTAVERDPSTAALLRANARQAHVIEGDITDPRMLGCVTADLGPLGLVYLDPARRDGTRSRDGRRAHPERDPQRWSPPWSFVLEVAERTRVCVKVAPGFSPERIPPGWCAAWIGTRHGPAEACLLSWPALPSPRRACVVTGERTYNVDADGDDVRDDDQAADDTAASAEVGGWLHEPAQVVVTADLVGALARQVDLTRLDRTTHWLTSTGPIAASQMTPLLASFRVLDELPMSAKEQRVALQRHGFADVTVKSRGTGISASQWRTRLRMPEGPSAVLVIIGGQGSHHAYLVQGP